MMDNNKLYFTLSQIFFNRSEISHHDITNNIYTYENIENNDNEMIIDCIEDIELNYEKKNHLEKKKPHEVDKFRLKHNKNDNTLTITRHGFIKSEMIFAPGGMTDFVHDSALGKIHFILNTTELNINEHNIEITYDLYDKENLLSKNKLVINI